MQYVTTYKDKSIKFVIGKMEMTFDEQDLYIWRLERRALQLHESISAFCRYAGLDKKIFIRLRQRGLYAINYLTLLRLCYGMKLSPNMLMRFEEWEDLKISTVEINRETLEKVRIDWKKSMDSWYANKKQKPLGLKRYGECKT